MERRIQVRPRIFLNGNQYHMSIRINDLVEISLWLDQQERDDLIEMLQRPPLPLGS